MRLEGFLIKLFLLIVTYFVRNENRPYKKYLDISRQVKILKKTTTLLNLKKHVSTETSVIFSRLIYKALVNIDLLTAQQSC